MPVTGHAPLHRARRSDFQRTRARIVSAARQLMGERGPESLTVSAVAHAAGINRTTAYQHFRTRDELVSAVTDELIREVGAFLASQHPMIEHIDAIIDYFFAHPELARLAIHWLMSDSPIPRAGMELFRNETRQAVAESGHDDADPEMLGHLMASVAVLWPLSARIQFEDPDARRAATARLTRELKRLLRHGLVRADE